MVGLACSAGRGALPAVGAEVVAAMGVVAKKVATSGMEAGKVRKEALVGLGEEEGRPAVPGVVSWYTCNVQSDRLPVRCAAASGRH